MINKIVIQNIKTLMFQKKIRPKQLPFNKVTSYHYLSGRRNLSLEVLSKFKELLNVNYSLLFSEVFYNKNINKSICNLNKNYKYNNLSERDNNIYYYRVKFNNKKTLKELGNLYNISGERVRQIQKEIINFKQKELSE
jgi:DNA-directed RNA polymerase sigma subunit (sigma70/sigma32)